MTSSKLLGSVTTLSLAFLGGIALISPACAGSPTDCDYGLCGNGTGAKAGSSGSANGAGVGGEDAGGGKSGAGGGKGGASGSSSGGTSGDAGSTGNGGEAGGGGCDTTQSPTEEACLVSDEFAVFVSPDGDDANDGMQGTPLATLTKAVEVAAGEKLVLVCDATYDEHVSITVGARIYGGFKCTDWSAEAANPLFKPTTAGVALKITGVVDNVLVEHVNFEVGDAAVAGETALVAIVNASPKVTLRAVSLKAGKGSAGANGSLAIFTYPDKATFKGNPESMVTPGTGGDSKTCTCQAGLQSVGGVGGTPVAGGQNGSKGQPEHGGGAGGDPAAGDCGIGVGGKTGSGSKGANAGAGGPANGAPSLGTATASTWQPTAGTDGATGQPGQGGGGGASFNASGHGGGGGCGGCGGNGGTAGKGGGGSIALLALNSPVALESSTLTTADAGNGGTGAAGQPGQKEAGGGGSVADSLNSCGGGGGGFGGDGGAGGGGAGGISVGIVWKGGMAPTVSADTTTTNGKAGTKGNGGAPGTNDGIAGVSQKILSLN